MRVEVFIFVFFYELFLHIYQTVICRNEEYLLPGKQHPSYPEHNRILECTFLRKLKECDHISFQVGWIVTKLS